jgi:hypothetical protein
VCGGLLGVPAALFRPGRPSTGYSSGERRGYTNAPLDTLCTIRVVAAFYRSGVTVKIPTQAGMVEAKPREWRRLFNGSGMSPRPCPKRSVPSLHALQKAKRVERANGDQFEAHHMCFTQRQLFDHFVSDGRIGDVDDERHARLSL